MTAEPDQITPGLVMLVAALVIAPAVFVPLIPRRWLLRVTLGWLFAPLGLMLALFVLLVLVGAGSESGGINNALLAVGYIGIFALAPWFVVALLGIGIGLLARRIWGRRAPDADREVENPPSPADVPAQPAERAVPVEPPPSVRRPVTLPAYTGMTTEQLHARIRELARGFGIEERFLTLIGRPKNGDFYAFVDHRGLQLGYFERGDMFDHMITRDLDEMLYWAFDHVTYAMAAEVARGDMTQGDEIGPRLLARQGELLAKLNPQWHARWRSDPFCRAVHYRREAHP